MLKGENYERKLEKYLVVTVGAFAVGEILCFGAFNPAVVLGLGVLGNACWCCVGLTILVNLIAAVVAGLVYKMTEIEE